MNDKEMQFAQSPAHAFFLSFVAFPYFHLAWFFRCCGSMLAAREKEPAFSLLWLLGLLIPGVNFIVIFRLFWKLRETAVAREVTLFPRPVAMAALYLGALFACGHFFGAAMDSLGESKVASGASMPLYMGSLISLAIACSVLVTLQTTVNELNSVAQPKVPMRSGFTLVEYLLFGMGALSHVGMLLMVLVGSHR